MLSVTAIAKVASILLAGSLLALFARSTNIGQSWMRRHATTSYMAPSAQDDDDDEWLIEGKSHIATRTAHPDIEHVPVYLADEEDSTRVGGDDLLLLPASDDEREKTDLAMPTAAQPHAAATAVPLVPIIHSEPAASPNLATGMVTLGEQGEVAEECRF